MRPFFCLAEVVRIAATALHSSLSSCRQAAVSLRVAGCVPLCLAVSLFAMPVAAADSLVDRALTRAKQLGLGANEVSLLLVSDSGVTLAAHREASQVPPASVLKLLTACAAYDLLGVDFKFRTELRHSGQVRADRDAAGGRGVLDGDLVVVGRGDPGFSGRHYDGDPMRAFEPWIAELRRRGIVSVTGALVGDDQYLAGPSRLADWPRDQLHRWYCAPSGALNLNDNCVDVCIAPAADGRRIGVLLRPATRMFQIDHQIRAVSTKKKHRYSVDRAPGEWAIVMRGGFLSTASERVEWISVPDPTAAFLAALHEHLRQRSIAIAGGHRAGSVANSKLLATIERPLVDAVWPLMKQSQNLFGDCLARVIDRESGGRGDFAGASQRLRDYLVRVIGAPAADGVVIRDGSGLSKQNRLSARALVALLRYANRQPWGRDLAATMPVAGEDGTLKKRFRKHPLRGQVRAKTGHIKGVSGLAGTAQTAAGEVHFALLFHGAAGKVAKARLWQEKVLAELVVK
ncbi:MAG: D-alanyl-D-alanine carboxypeptidase/D-alanyl-D-alanine-endopeptidase [Planctomycetota bacterium]